MKSMIGLSIAVGMLAAPLVAQTPKPGPEQTRIGYFSGRWTTEGEAQPTPMGPGGKFTETSTCEWFEGGFHLVCRSEGTGPTGAMKSQSIMGYDPNQKTYTYYSISSMGEGELVRGTVSGKVWTWNLENMVEGKSMKIRFTITEESPTSYTFRGEASFDGAPWAVVTEGKATKAG